MENPKDSTQTLLELIHEFSSIKSMYRSLLYFYTPVMKQKKEKSEKKSIPFTIMPKTIRYLGINLTKEVKDLYSENHRTLMKDTE